MSAGVTPIALNGTADTVITAAGLGRSYHGITVRETSGSAAAVLRIRDGVGGVIVDTIQVPTSGSFSIWYEQGILCPHGLYEDFVSGAYEGTVRVGDG